MVIYTCEYVCTCVCVREKERDRVPYSPLWERQHLMSAPAKVFLLCSSSPKLSPSSKVCCVTAGGRVSTGVARPWSSSRLSCGARLLLRCDGNTGNSIPTTEGRIPALELGGGNGAPLDVGGTLVLPLEWRRVCRGTS